MGVTAFNRYRSRRREQAQRTTQNEETTSTTEPVHIGGGWYRVPGLEDPVQGKEAAEEAARNQG